MTQTDNFQAEEGKTLDKNHWAYKTLVDINKKYNVNLDKSSEKFFLKKTLTRNEAAFLLISLISKINQNNIQLTEFEKAKSGQVSEGFGKDFKLTGSMQGRYAGNIKKGKDNYAPNFSIALANPGFYGNLNEHILMMANFQPGRYYDSPSAKSMMQNIIMLIFKTDLIYRCYLQREFSLN